MTGEKTSRPRDGESRRPARPSRRGVEKRSIDFLEAHALRKLTTVCPNRNGDPNVA
jgi:hypothetical protein